MHQEFGDSGCMDAGYALGLWAAGSHFKLVEATLRSSALPAMVRDGLVVYRRRLSLIVVDGISSLFGVSVLHDLFNGILFFLFFLSRPLFDERPRESF